MDQSSQENRGSQGSSGQPIEAPRPVPVYLQTSGGSGPRRSFLGSIGRYVLLVLFFVSLILNFYLVMILKAGIEEAEYRPGWKNQKIALIDVSGMITMRSPQDLRRMLRKANEDDTVKGVILVVNSPGGQVVPSAMMHRYIMEFRDPPLTWSQRKELEGMDAEEREELEAERVGKPVYAAIEQLGASGAYWTAVAAEQIYANENAIVGSIGVIYMNAVLKGLLEEKLSITPVVIESSRSPKKDEGSFLRMPTEEEKREIQGDLDTIHQRFVAVVQQGRGMTEEQAWLVSTGETFDGPASVELGLVDEVGFLDDAIDAMAEELGIERPMVVRYTQPPSLLEMVGLRTGKGALGFDVEGQVETWATTPRIQALWLGQ